MGWGPASTRSLVGHWFPCRVRLDSAEWIGHVINLLYRRKLSYHSPFKEPSFNDRKNFRKPNQIGGTSPDVTKYFCAVMYDSVPASYFKCQGRWISNAFKCQDCLRCFQKTDSRWWVPTAWACIHCASSPRVPSVVKAPPVRVPCWRHGPLQKEGWGLQQMVKHARPAFPGNWRLQQRRTERLERRGEGVIAFEWKDVADRGVFT